jgi:hypothetical protein
LEIVPGLLDPIATPELVPVPRGWAHRREVVAQHTKAIHQLVSGEIPQPESRTDQGVLLCGGGKYWLGVVIACRLLREVGCTLPIQVWHRGDEEPIRPADLANLDVKIVDARKVQQKHPARILRGWEIKTYAILHSGFARVLYLDADAYCVRDPSPLFALLDAEPFLFWQDLPGTERHIRWRFFGIPEDQGKGVPPVQGGQLLIDVAGFYRELSVAHWLNQHSDYAYSHQYGDQDSYRVAMALLGSYPARAKSMGLAKWQRVAFVCSHAKANYIVHRCQGKLFPPGTKGGNARVCNTLPLEDRVQSIYQDLCFGLGKASLAAKSIR